MNRATIKICLLTGFLSFSDIVKAQTSAQIKAERAAKIKHLVAVINKHPDSLQAHEEYIWLPGMEDSTLQKRYRVWAAQYPNLINIPFAIGRAFNSKGKPQAVEFLLEAVKVDSTRADIWKMLAGRATSSGEYLRANQYYKKATLLKPNNGDYALAYAFSFKNIDTAIQTVKLWDVAKRFEGNMYGARALYWIADNSKDTLTQINVLERLYRLYKLKNESAISGSNMLYNIYLQIDPEKALLMCDENKWTARKIQAQQIIAINNLTARHNYKQALVLIDSLRNRKDLYAADFLFYKQAELLNLTGDTHKAYDILFTRMVAAPSHKLRDLLVKYGQKIGKIEDDLYADIWKAWDRTAVIAPVFSSKLYTEDRRVSLRDFRGKVTLLTFWFPTCGPCRAEFPHFENVMKKVDRQQVAYIGVNGEPSQDKDVLKVVENDKLTFAALHGNPEVAEKLYKFRGYPSNHVLDQQGRIIFSDFQIREYNEDMLELILDIVLKNGKEEQPRMLVVDSTNMKR